MKVVISEWNTVREFGFVVINGQRVFVHYTSIYGQRTGKLDLTGQPLDVREIDWKEPKGPKVTKAFDYFRNDLEVVYHLENYGGRETPEFIGVKRHLSHADYSWLNITGEKPRTAGIHKNTYWSDGPVGRWQEEDFDHMREWTFRLTPEEIEMIEPAFRAGLNFEDTKEFSSGVAFQAYSEGIFQRYVRESRVQWDPDIQRREAEVIALAKAGEDDPWTRKFPNSFPWGLFFGAMMLRETKDVLKFAKRTTSAIDMCVKLSQEQRDKFVREAKEASLVEKPDNVVEEEINHVRLMAKSLVDRMEFESVSDYHIAVHLELLVIARELEEFNKKQSEQTDSKIIRFTS